MFKHARRISRLYIYIYTHKEAGETKLLPYCSHAIFERPMVWEDGNAEWGPISQGVQPYMQYTRLYTNPILLSIHKSPATPLLTGLSIITSGTVHPAMPMRQRCLASGYMQVIKWIWPLVVSWVIDPSN